MRLTHAKDIEWDELSGHRAGTILFKFLLAGRAGDPGNFELSLVRADGDYSTPRHRHNFDQIRLALEGRFNFARKRDLEEGAVGYFPEGTAYGPQEAHQRSIILLLQFGGASGEGFMAYDQLRAGFQAMRERGSFEGGVFRGGNPERPVNRDGYEAIWEHVNGRSIRYPRARYEEPVIMQPASYSWRPLAAGVERKRLGVFTEAETEVGLIRAQGSATIELEGAAIAFLLEGGLRAGDDSLGRWSAAHIEPEERVTFEAEEPSELLYVRLPTFD